MGDRAAPLPADSQYRSSIPLPACIQPQHEHLAEQVRCLKEEVARLERRQFLIQSSRKSMLDKLCESLGWQGGTIHQVLAEVGRLKAKDASCQLLNRDCQTGSGSQARS